MTRIAVYPGSFDPPTKGHEDLVRRSLALADRVIVAVAVNPSKQPLFPVEQRLAMLRARRAVSDFEYETQMALMHRRLHPSMETVFLVSALDLTYLSSSLVREV